jgi:Ca2+-binding EF-hand superfamily protein
MFKRYDRDESGELSMREVSSILLDFGLQPRSREELDEIQAMMEEADSDGSNEINFEEFCVLFQRIQEKIQAMIRESERKKAFELGFSKASLQELRKAFEALDEDLSGGLDVSEVRKGLKLMRRELSALALRDVFDSLDTEDTGELDLMAFIALIKFIDENAKSLVPAHDGSGHLDFDNNLDLIIQGRKDEKRPKQNRTTAMITQISQPEPEKPISRTGRRAGIVPDIGK